MEEATRLDEVTVFGGKLSFLIPHSWEEQSGDDDYLYSDPGTNSGWFRVSLSTARAVDETPAQMLKRKFEGRKNVTEDTQTGNWVCTYERDSEEKGEKIRLYYWVVAHVVEPDLVRQALFSYTVISERIDEQQTRKLLGLLGQIVSRANFTPEPTDSSILNS